MKSSATVELKLNIRLPEDYKEFLDQTGYLLFNSTSKEIYGYKPGFDMEKIPCVIAATKLYKKDYDLKSSEIVISHTGYEDYIVSLDTESGSVYELSNTEKARNKIAESFSNWLSELVANDRNGD